MNADSQSTSLTLLNQLRQAPTDATWERFVNLYAPLLRVWVRARARARDAAAAEDVVQTVLLKLQTALPKYRREDGKSFRSWLYTVTAHTARDFARSPATRDLPTADGLADVPDAPPADCDELEHRRFVVNRALALVRPEFGSRTWAAFAGVMLDNRPAAEVAAELGITANAVFLARHRVLARLRREIDGFLD